MLKIAKSGKYLVNFYSNLVAEFYYSNFKVQSWMNGSGGKLLPNCTVTNMSVVSNQYIKIGNLGWKTSSDHSKYAISMNKNIPIVCLGDVNRMESQ